jgi:histidine triad (HIT) family protein
MAFLDYRPLAAGHVLLIPRNHVTDLIELPDDLIAPLFRNAKLLARALEIGLDAEGVFVATNVKISQSIPHLHIHLVPRRAKDGLFSQKLIWKRAPYPDETEALGLQDRIRRGIDEIRRG